MLRAPAKYPSVNGVTTYPDGSQWCDLRNCKGLIEYKHRTAQMYFRQDCVCAICGEWMDVTAATFDHEAGRGANRQDDRIEVDGQWINAALCLPCNGLKGSRKYHWQDGKYVEVGR